MRIEFEPDEKPVLLQRLELAEDASDEDIAVAAATLLTPEQSPPPPETPPPAASAESEEEEEEEVDEDLVDDDDDDLVTMDKEAYKKLTARAKRSDVLEVEARDKVRDDTITAAVKAGKFGRARVKHYTERWNTDPEGTQRAIGRMQKGVVPVEERGADAAEDDAEDPSAYPKEWVPEVGAREQRAATRGSNGSGQPKIVKLTRVHSEE